MLIADALMPIVRMMLLILIIDSQAAVGAPSSISSARGGERPPYVAGASNGVSGKLCCLYRSSIIAVMPFAPSFASAVTQRFKI